MSSFIPSTETTPGTPAAARVWTKIVLWIIANLIAIALFLTLASPLWRPAAGEVGRAFGEAIWIVYVLAPLVAVACVTNFVIAFVWLWTRRLPRRKLMITTALLLISWGVAVDYSISQVVHDPTPMKVWP